MKKKITSVFLCAVLIVSGYLAGNLVKHVQKQKVIETIVSSLNEREDTEIFYDKDKKTFVCRMWLYDDEISQMAFPSSDTWKKLRSTMLDTYDGLLKTIREIDSGLSLHLDMMDKQNRDKKIFSVEDGKIIYDIAEELNPAEVKKLLSEHLNETFEEKSTSQFSYDEDEDVYILTVWYDFEEVTEQIEKGNSSWYDVRGNLLDNYRDLKKTLKEFDPDTPMMMKVTDEKNHDEVFFIIRDNEIIYDAAADSE